MNSNQNTHTRRAFGPWLAQALYNLGLCATLGLSLCLTSAPAHADEPDVLEILRGADLGRGGGLPGLVWEVQTHNRSSSANGNAETPQPDQSLRIKAIDQASVAEVLDPPSSRGSKILQVDRNMWMSKPGLKKPIAISPRQRLTGQASIGDIAATNYAKDYSATYLRTEEIEGEPCHVLDLKSKNQQSTYDRITYWVSVKRGVAVQAEFLSLSGKKLKSANFDYKNQIVHAGKRLPFISRMTISDALTDAQTVMDYSKVRTQALSTAEFDVGNLQ